MHNDSEWLEKVIFNRKIASYARFSSNLKSNFNKFIESINILDFKWAF